MQVCTQLSQTQCPTAAHFCKRDSMVFTACGVAHQALEEIEPKGDNILIQGEYDHMIMHVTSHVTLELSWGAYPGCGPVGLFAVGLARVMGATKM